MSDAPSNLYMGRGHQKRGIMCPASQAWHGECAKPEVLLQLMLEAAVFGDGRRHTAEFCRNHAQEQMVDVKS